MTKTGIIDIVNAPPVYPNLSEQAIKEFFEKNWEPKCILIPLGEKAMKMMDDALRDYINRNK